MTTAHIRQVDSTDCGPACLASILATWGRSEPLYRLRELAGTTQGGTSFLGLMRAAKKLSVTAKAFEADTEALSQLDLPAVLHWQGKHYVVLWKIRGQRALLGDPAQNKRHWVSIDELKKHWTGKLLTFKPEISFERGQFIGKRGVVGLFAHLSHFRSAIGPLIEVGLATLVLSLLGLGAPILSQILFDRVLTFRERDLLTPMLLGMFLLSAFQTVFGAARSYLAGHLSMRLDYRLHMGYLDHLLRLPLRIHETRLIGDLMARFSDLGRVKGVLSNLIISLPVSIFTLILSTILLVLYNPKLALVASINIPLQMAYLFILSPQLRQNSRKATKKSSDVQSFLLGSLEGIPTLKALSAEPWALQRGRDQVSGLLDLSAQGLGLSTVGSAVFGFLGSASSMVMLWFGATQVLGLELSLGQLVAANALMSNAVGAFAQITGMITGIQEGIVASDRLAEVLELDPETSNSDRKLQALQQEIVVEGLRFGYTERPILRDVHFRLPQGSYTAFLGNNGSGKSTLAAMLARLSDPEAGRILWDGQNLAEMPTNAVRERVVYLRQEVPLFYASLRENLSLGANIPDEQLWATLAELGLAQVAKRLPEGLDTVVGGESLFKFSSGERQMLGLARALLSPADLLILDEPTATLDLEREQQVVALLTRLKGQRTMLIITHRPALIEPADQVLRLSEGVVVIEPSPDPANLQPPPILTDVPTRFPSPAL
jgi:ABC-type bacteriocin/lantibiotic exporter with double-glycine peptidase domain